jgi:hypothetical protein
MGAEKKRIINSYLVYLATSIAFGGLVTVLALWSSPNTWSDFFNSKPIRGEMGFGRFVIRGSRYINGINTTTNVNIWSEAHYCFVCR